jgi:hypothetical protein
VSINSGISEDKGKNPEDIIENEMQQPVDMNNKI